jgi:putative ABC transport system substrate-binding protein
MLPRTWQEQPMPFGRLRRRQFITLLGSSAAWPMVAHGQQLAMPLIGYLDPWSAEDHRPELTAFRRGLNEVGFIENRNVMIE